jgi:parallel beta-helix repeat protein
MIVVRRAVLAALACLTLTLLAVPPASASAAPETVTCGEAITHSIVIANDLGNCGFGKTALTVGADHITIDFNGHGVGAVYGAALSSTGHSFVTIENGTFGDNAIALRLSGDHNDLVRNVSANGGGEGAGVSLSGGSQNSVVDSTLSSGPECCAPLELNGENNDVIGGNTALGYQGLQIGAGAGNQVTRNTTGTIHVSGSGDLIEANIIAPYSGMLTAGLTVEGDNNSVIANSVSGSTFSFGQLLQFPEGITVTGSGNVLSGNTATGNVRDGIHVLDAGNTLSANVADDNGAFGIEAVSGVIDGGENRASGNGNPAQCLNINCSGLPLPHAPATPSGLTAAPGNGSVALSWQPNLAADAVLHYSVFRTDQNFSGAWATPLGTAFTNASDVVNGTRYCYQVSATNSRGESARSTPVCATPTGPPNPPPATPTGLTASPGNGSVALSWQPNPAADAVLHYNVYRADQTFFGGAWATASATAYTDAFDVVNGTRYCYEVSATSSTGEGARSATVCATPTGPANPPPPTPPAPPTPTAPTTPPPATRAGHGLASSHRTPRLTSTRFSSTTFRAASSGAALTRHGTAGVWLSYRLSEAATVTFRVQRQRTIHGHTRWVTLTRSFSWASPAGTTRLRFTGRIAGKKLPSGRYRLILTARARASHAAAPISSSPFTITR